MILNSYKFPTVNTLDFLESERVAFRVKPREKPVEWAEKNLQLVSPGYTQPGPFKARPWQREIINACVYWDRIYEAGCTQAGKSTNFDIPCYYYMDLGVNGMVAYANSKVVESVFKLRISEMITSKGEYKNPVLTELWSGKDDDLTIQNLRLRNCIWRIASAQNKNDLASFPAGICIGSEVAKWEKQIWNPIRMLEGRQGSYEGSTDKKLFLESSPYEVDDYLYRAVFKLGTLILQPHYQCPHCGFWQTWTDYQIKLRNPESDHSPARIREEKEAAVYYECVNCKQEITEAQRAEASEHVIWAAPEIETETFHQKAETIYPDGTIPTRLEGGRRSGYDAVCYNFPRLVDTAYQFWKCLAYFFECKNDPEDKKVYENETMARWVRKKSERIEISTLESKKEDYYQYGQQRKIPEGVLVLTVGGDTQDNGFYQSWYGWGYNMQCWMIKSEFVYCPIDEFKDPREVYVKFIEGLYGESPLWPDGTPAEFKFGFLDRGGHRAEHVDFICQRTHNLKPYIGLTRVHDDKPVIFKSDNGNWFLGQPELLSLHTGTIMASDDFFLPADVSREYLSQLVRQFFLKKVSPEGKVYDKWVHGYQGEDHYRDCFNLAYAAAKHLNLDKVLIDRVACETLRANHFRRTEIIKTENNNLISNVNTPRPGRSSGGYFSRAYGR